MTNEIVRALAVQAVLLAAAILAAVTFARRRPALRHTMLFAALSVGALVPVAPRLSRPALPTWTSSARPATPATSLSGGPLRSTPLPARHDSTPRTVAPPEGPLKTTRLNAATWLFALWAVGALLFLARLAHGLRRVSALRALALQSPPVRASSLARLQPALGDVPQTTFRVSDLVAGPMTIGLRQPLVLIPTALERALDDETLHQVLSHELAHVRRHDNVVALVTKLIAAIFWFQPLVHLVNLFIARTREELCDNAVLQHTSPADYARTLLRLSEHSSGAHLAHTSPLLGARFGLEQRVRALLSSGGSMDMTVSAPVQTLVLATIGAAALLGCARAQADSAVAWVDVPRAIDEVTEAEPAVTNLKARKKERYEHLAGRVRALNEQTQSFQREKHLLPEPERSQRELTLQREVQSLRETQQQHDIHQKAEERAIAEQLKPKLEAIVQEMARERGFAAIVNKKQALYVAGGTTDLTDELVRRYKERAREVTAPVSDHAQWRLGTTTTVESMNLRSASSREPTMLCLENVTSKAVTVEWIDFSGTSRFYGELAPGAHKLQATFDGHLFVFSQDGHRRSFKASASGGPSRVVIDDSLAAPERRRAPAPQR